MEINCILNVNIWNIGSNVIIINFQTPVIWPTAFLGQYFFANIKKYVHLFTQYIFPAQFCKPTYYITSMTAATLKN